VSWNDSGFKKNLDTINKRVDRATMWALREAGRKVKQEARRNAPVYQGAATLTYRQFKTFQKTTGYKGSIGNDVVISGLLKNSISSSKRLKVKTGEYSLKVGPRGQRVHLYAAKAEARHPYMKPGRDAADAQLKAICVKAWGKAIKV
jgi:hypothetical protein